MAIAPPTKIPETNPTGWLDAFAKQVGSYDPVTQSIVNTSPGASASIESLLSVLTGRATGDEFSKSAAFRDSDAILAQIFNDFKQGALPQIYQQQAASGAYNSTSAQMLANDAFAKTVAQGQAAKLKAAVDYGQVQNQQGQVAAQAANVAKGVNPVQTSKAKSSPISTLMNVARVGEKVLPYLFNKGKLTKGSEAYNGLIGSDPSAALNPSFGSSTGFGGTFGSPTPSVFTDFSAPVAGGTDFNSILFNQALGIDTPSVIPEAVGAADFSSLGASAYSPALVEGIDVIGAFELGATEGATLAGEATLGAEAASSFSAAGAAAPYLGAAVLGAQLGYLGKTEGAPTGNIASLLTGGDLVSGSGTDWSAVTDEVTFGLLGDGGNSIGGSVVCTELLSQGKMSFALYKADIDYARCHLSPITLRGYRFWAVPFVKKMRSSPILSKGAAWFALHRAASLLEFNWKGSLIRFIFEPVCFLLGFFVKERDWKGELYGVK